MCRSLWTDATLLRNVGEIAHVARHYLYGITEFSLYLPQCRLAAFRSTADHGHTEVGGGHATGQLAADARIVPLTMHTRSAMVIRRTTCS